MYIKIIGWIDIDTKAKLLDPNWKYVPANRTNVAETFKKFGFVPPSEQKLVEQDKK